MDHHKFTEQYLEIIRDTLQISENESGRVSCRWDHDTADDLARRLENHMNTFTEDAILSAKASAEDQMYSYHFGLSPHLNETLKYAPLYTDHIVLQDIVYRTLLGRDNYDQSKIKNSVLGYVNNILKWEPLIEGGYISILPSSQLWSGSVRDSLHGMADGKRQICNQSLLASNKLGTTPFTDSPDYKKYMTLMAIEAKNLIESVEEGDLTAPNPTSFDTRSSNARVRTVGSRLFRHPDSTAGLDPESPADLLYITGASYEEVIELAEEFEGFKSKFRSIIEELARVPENEIDDVIEKAPDKIAEEYKDTQKLAVSRKMTLAGTGIAGLALSLPVFVSITPQDLFISSTLISSFSGMEELLEHIINVAGGVSGTLTLREIVEEMWSEEYDFYNVVAELDAPVMKNGHVESLSPV